MDGAGGTGAVGAYEGDWGDGAPVLRIMFRKRTVVSMAVTGAALAGTAVSIGIGAHRSGGSLLATMFTGLVGFVAVLVLAGAVMAALRRRPVIEAGAAGVAVANFGMVKALVLGWEEIAGFEVVGKGRMRMLVVTGLDPETLRRQPKALRQVTERLNVQHKQPGLVYVHRSMMAVTPEEAAARLRALALAYVDQEGSDGAGRSHRHM